MKIERALLNYLIKTKRLPLQGIGVFELEGTVAGNAENQKAVIIPEGAITFLHTPVTGVDEELIEFVSEQTGKIKPLALSDLESYLILGRQFINLGNPFIIPGIGSLEKDKTGNLIFRQGAWVAERLENEVRSEIKDETVQPTPENAIDDFRRPGKTNRGKSVLIAIGILIIGLVVWAVWRFSLDNASQTEVEQSSVVGVDSDSTEATTAPSEQAFTPLTGFKVIVNQYNSLERANKRSNDLKRYGRNVMVYTKDSVTYFVAESLDLPLSDTTRVLDSLRGYYGASIRQIDY